MPSSILTYGKEYELNVKFGKAGLWHVPPMIEVPDMHYYLKSIIKHMQTSIDTCNIIYNAYNFHKISAMMLSN